jgi:ubiquinone/menaquinone biosynthesis C-methylase UbiE
LEENLEFDSILCDLGLSGFPEWEQVIDNLISLLKLDGKLVVMDWYIEKPSLRGNFIKWIGKGEVNRPIYHYMEKRLPKFELNKSFKNGEMFVAIGTKRI